MVCTSLRCEELGLCRPIKKHSFHSWRKLSEGRRCQSPERSGAAGRGSEHGAGLVYAPRRAAQAGLTGGADRSSRLRWETNVAKNGQPKAEPKSEELASSGQVLLHGEVLSDQLTRWCCIDRLSSQR